MSNWKTLKSEVVYETPWFKIYRDEVLNQNSDPLTYSYMELQNASVFIVAVNPDGKILMQKVYRYPLRTHVWEIPAGYSERGEDFLDSAKRELQEEASLISDDWHRIGHLQQITGTGNVPVEVFLAKQVRDVGGSRDADEDISGHTFMPLSEIEKMLADGGLVDSPVIAALYMAKNYGLK